MKALEGTKVLDLCRGYPPAYAATTLADFGADVIKVDPVGFVTPSTSQLSLTEEKLVAYRTQDRNKRSIQVNFRSERGKEVILRLAGKADVLIENSRPGTMESLGLGYNTLKNMNPRIIYCSVSGYGQNGPYRDLVGHDANFLGVAGILSLIGPKDGPPTIPSNFIADMAGGYLCTLSGILIALLAREKTGRGQFIDISYTDGAFSLLGLEVAMHFLTGKERRRGETFQTGSDPCASVYKTKDGEYVVIFFMEPQFWANFCRAISREDLTNRQHPRNDVERQEMFSFLRKLFLTKTRDEWWDWAKDKQVMLTPVKYLEEAINDPQLKHRQMVLELDHPVLGKVIQVGSPFKLSDTPPRFKSFGPLSGQHADEILQELGCNEQQIKQLRQEGAVG